ncbi:RES family NAD+ phosphorylase, partial [bacterium]|nr:RES family NAD+ phosphorylase [bacterium]
MLQEANVESPWQGTLSRVVESQQRIATLHLVDSLEEQAVLEALIDQAKPPASIDHDKFHYLISSPFRYPPLRHGSRFGSRYEPSLFYGSLSIQCALAECAYYRFVFLEGMSEPIAAPVRSEHSSF